jgi:hypothetical protein
VAIVAIGNYDVYRYLAGYPMVLDYHLAVTTIICLSPIPVIVGARRVAVIVIAYAAVLSMILAGYADAILLPSLTGVGARDVGSATDYWNMWLAFLCIPSSFLSGIFTIVWIAASATNAILRLKRKVWRS